MGPPAGGVQHGGGGEEEQGLRQDSQPGQHLPAGRQSALLLSGIVAEIFWLCSFHLKNSICYSANMISNIILEMDKLTTRCRKVDTVPQPTVQSLHYETDSKCIIESCCMLLRTIFF